MNTYIALFRGINVGGHNRVPMKELRSLMRNLGHQNVDTYIQTGNAVFKTESDIQQVSDEIGAEIKKSYGFEPHVLILTPEDLQNAVESNPFPEAVSEPKSLHLYFLISEPKNPDLESLKDIKKENERFELRDKVFYLHAPDGIGRSKLAGMLSGRAEKVFGSPVTGRNWRTVQKVLRMVEDE